MFTKSQDELIKKVRKIEEALPQRDIRVAGNAILRFKRILRITAKKPRYRDNMKAVMRHAYLVGAHDQRLNMLDPEGFADRNVDREIDIALCLLIGED